MTNAHVLAGVAAPQGRTPRARQYHATPVYIDEETDIAVLDVPGLPEVPLPFAPQPAATGTDTIIMGYPGGGGLYIGPARVRDRGEISGPDFRNQRTVLRDVYALYGTVRAGNSGGPLFAPTARCSASCSPRPSTTRAPATRSPRQQVAKAATAGSTATAEVGTGPCE